MKWIKAATKLPVVGIYNCLYNGDHCIFQVHDGGFRIINYHGEKTDDPKLNLVKWLDESDEWIAVTDAENLFQLQGTHHFLVPVIRKKSNKVIEYWDIITGYIDDSGDLLDQCNDSESGWQYTDVIYYKPVGELPPLPSKPQGDK